MSISVEGHILVFDEGHNMEDAAREAASYTLSNHDLLDVLADIDRVKELLGAVGEGKGRGGRGGGEEEGEGEGREVEGKEEGGRREWREGEEEEEGGREGEERGRGGL